MRLIAHFLANVMLVTGLECSPAQDVVSAGTYFSCGITYGPRCFAHAMCTRDVNFQMTLHSLFVCYPASTCKILRFHPFRVVCWGSNAKQQSEVSEQIQEAHVHTVVSGSDHSCALGKLNTDNLLCWGKDSKGETAVPSGKTWVELAAGIILYIIWPLR